MALSINIDKITRTLVNNPQIESIGFKQEDISKEAIQKITKMVKLTLENLTTNKLKLNEIKEKLENEIKAVIKNESSIKPNILILLSEIPSK